MRVPWSVCAAALLACGSTEPDLEHLLNGDYELFDVDGAWLPALVPASSSTLKIWAANLSVTGAEVFFEDRVTLIEPTGETDLSVSCKLAVVGLTSGAFSLVPAAVGGCPFSAEVDWEPRHLSVDREGIGYHFVRVPCIIPIPGGSPPTGGPQSAPNHCVQE